MSERVVTRLKQIAEERWADLPKETDRKSHVCWAAADELEKLRAENAALRSAKAEMEEVVGQLMEAVEECLREHGGFTIRGECERNAKAALAAVRSKGFRK